MNLHRLLLLAWLLIAVSGLAGAEEIVHCHYVPIQSPENPQPQMDVFDDCATLEDDGTITFHPEHFAAFKFDEERSLAEVLVSQCGWHYVKPDGTYASVVLADNGADYFVEGLARTVIDGKIAYIDEDLEVVLRTRYTWGWPFRDGYAMVCDGCRLEDSDEDSHKLMIEGKWGYIDHQGKEVVPVRYSREELWEMERP